MIKKIYFFFLLNLTSTVHSINCNVTPDLISRTSFHVFEKKIRTHTIMYEIFRNHKNLCKKH
jgi:hypothetical protein